MSSKNEAHVTKFEVGDLVVKTSGDYTFFGVVVSVFKKTSGAVRYVVENSAGILLIMNEKQLTRHDDKKE